MGCSLLGGGWGADWADMTEKLSSGSIVEVMLRGRTTGMGLVRKSPVCGSTLAPIGRLLSKRIGSAGLPVGGGGEKRSLRRVGAAGGALLILETSKKSLEALEARGGSVRDGPTATTASSSELSLLISTILFTLAAVRMPDRCAA